MLLSLLLCLLSVARAGPDDTRAALDRLEEVLELRIDDGTLRREDVLPALLVSAEPRYTASTDWFSVRAIEVLERSFGNGSLRMCEACMAPRVLVEDGAMLYHSGPIGLDEVALLDERGRGAAPAAKTAIWLDEHRGGVAIRIVDIDTGRIVFAQNVDPDLIEYKNTRRMYTLSAELERRARGDSITQSIVDLGVYPRPHIALDWVEHWGPTNSNLSGVTLSLVDPVVGVGANHYRATQLFNTMVGAKVLVSLPTALVNSVTGDNADIELFDNLITVAGVVRVPIARYNTSVTLIVSTNGTISLGVSLLNFTLLPVLP